MLLKKLSYTNFIKFFFYKKMKFRYKAINSKKQEVKGEVEAKNKIEAQTLLQNAGYSNVFIATDFNLQTAREVIETSTFSIFEKVSLKDMVNMSRQMSALLGAGVSVLKAFQLLSEDTQKGIFKKVLDNIVANIKSGVSISQALAKHPKAFDDFYVSMVRSGEESGKLAQTFTYLADYLDRAYALTTKVRNSMIYPSFVIAVFFIVMILIFTTVIPKLSVILNESGVELPWITQIILGISNFLISYGIYLVVILAGLGIYTWYAIRDTNSFQIWLDKVKLKLPVIKNIFKMLYVTRIADNIETLLGSGVSLTKSIQISADVVGNVYYKKVMDKALVDVKAGMAFSQSLSANKELIPSAMVQMVKIGEETGEMGKLMGNVAKFYQREINGAVETMLGLIEPVMIVLLGLGVGVLLISVLLPIYNLAGAF
jgi:type IV pilus assembly protein PilC